VAAFDEARRTGGAFSVEHRVRSAAGDHQWFLVRAEPHRDPATGEIVRWFGVSVNIHDRKTAEAELEHAHRLLQEQAAELETQAEELQASASDLAEQVEVADRALAAARASEARYRGLFEALDEGFCVVDVLFDAAGRPADYRFVETNAAFEEQTGLERRWAARPASSCPASRRTGSRRTAAWR
jgi:PAS domain-containing protein